MDNVTHSLVGLMMARAGLNRGERGGALMVILAANVPDIDGYSIFTDNLKYLEHHRGYMHAIPFAPLVALIPLLLVKSFTRTRITLWSYFACVVAVLSHLALDWTNAYGIRLMLPFSAHWFRLDINPLLEPLLLLILMAAWAAPALWGSKLAWAWFALIAFTSYDTARWIAHRQAISMLAANYRDAQRVSAFPAGWTLVQWRGVVEAPGVIYDLPLRVTKPIDPALAQIARMVEKDPAIDIMRSTRPFQVFESFDQLPFWKLIRQRDATGVELLDLRFGSLSTPGFRAVGIVKWPSGEVLASRVIFGGR